MCHHIKELKFCTCVNEPVVHHKKSRKRKQPSDIEKPVYRWLLLRYIKNEYSGERGKVKMPSGDIGNGLTEDAVLSRLNTANCFDFDYTPQEKDTLQIQAGSQWEAYLSCTFLNNTWQAGSGYDAFNDMLENIGRGKLKLLTEDDEN